MGGGEKGSYGLRNTSPNGRPLGVNKGGGGVTGVTHAAILIPNAAGGLHRLPMVMSSLGSRRPQPEAQIDASIWMGQFARESLAREETPGT